MTEKGKKTILKYLYLLSISLFMHLSQNITKGILGIILVSSIIGGVSYAQTIPKEYYPNYAIQADREKIEDYFVQIEAAQKI